MHQRVTALGKAENPCWRQGAWNPDSSAIPEDRDCGTVATFHKDLLPRSGPSENGFCHHEIELVRAYTCVWGAVLA